MAYTGQRVKVDVKIHSTYESSKLAEIMVKNFQFEIEEIQTDNGFEFTNRSSYNTSMFSY